MRFPFARLRLCRRLPSLWTRTLHIPSRGGLWRRRFRLFAAREQWSLRLRLRASTAVCLSSPRHRGVEADHRPLCSEPVCGLDSVSDGDCPDGSSLCAKERLDGLHRSEGCVPSDPDPPCQPQVSQVHSRGKDLAVSSPLLWAPRCLKSSLE